MGDRVIPRTGDGIDEAHIARAVVHRGNQIRLLRQTNNELLIGERHRTVVGDLHEQPLTDVRR